MTISKELPDELPSVQSLTLLTYFRGFHPACRVRGVLG